MEMNKIDNKVDKIDNRNRQEFSSNLINKIDTEFMDEKYLFV